MTDPVIYHGTPLTPRAALESMAGRAFCVSFFTPTDIPVCDRIASALMLDNGAFSFWMQARRRGQEADETARDWRPYYEWCERWLTPGRWAVIPDAIGAPSQINDGLINEWPQHLSGAPVWHMNGPIERLGRLCERWPLVCLGWVGETATDNIVGSDAYRRRMDEVAAFLGPHWPRLHMLRGTAVARDYPFRQRRQHVTCAKRMAVRQPARRRSWRSVARTASLCGQARGASR